MHAIAYAAIAASALPAVRAWGSLGHATVAFIAQNFLEDQTVTWAQDILDIHNDTYLASIASWADSYRYTDEGSWSAPLHFIDAEDSPPSSCSVDFERDCPAEGCSVSAIANFDGRLSADHTKQALEFLVHFFGDVTQPLHDEAEEVGGNDIDVTFDGEKTNLHHIWDTNMPEKLVGGYALDDARSWASNLTTEIKSGAYKSDAAGWIAGMDLSDAQGTALRFAQDANTFVCSTVLKGGESAVEGTDLGGAYYQNAIAIFTQQIAKGGYRLGAWLNMIATGSNGLGASKRLVRERPWERMCGR
ncbi:MAG: hypothetical protein Q9162_004994 [Coniocarpon cinnabarinum]